MVDVSTKNSNTVHRLLARCKSLYRRHYSHVSTWKIAMEQGSYPYKKPNSLNTQRINLGAFINNVLPRLDSKLSNYREAVFTAIDSCKPDQYTKRKHIKEAAISHLKNLSLKQKKFKKLIIELKEFKFVRTKDPEQPTIKEEHINLIIDKIEKSPRETKQKLLDKALILTLFYSGMRQNEITSLEINDVDLENKRIYINHSKGGKSRIIAINKKLLPWLIEFNQRFTTRHTNQFFTLTNGGILSPDRLYRRITKLTKQLGLSGGCHQFRRGFVTHFAQLNIPMAELQKMVGHSQLRTTMLYYKPDTEQILNSMENW